jgi:hypothetical protein
MRRADVRRMAFGMSALALLFLPALHRCIHAVGAAIVTVPSVVTLANGVRAFLVFGHGTSSLCWPGNLYAQYMEPRPTTISAGTIRARIIERMQYEQPSAGKFRTRQRGPVCIK